MALLRMTFFSKALGNSTDITVMVPTPYAIDPEEGDDYYWKEGVKFPVLYLLHGTWADHNDWARLTSIERYALKEKVVVVCPSGGNSGWQDMEIGPKVFTFVTEELPKYMKVMFPISDKREDTYIGGLSMGGIGALNIGIRKPEQYGAVCCFSGCCGSLMLENLDPETHPWPIKAILPPPYDGVGSGLDDVPVLKKAVEAGVELPRLYFATGTEDFIYDRTKKTLEILDDLGVEYTFEQGPGIHDWVFWDKYVQSALKWLHIRKPERD